MSWKKCRLLTRHKVSQTTSAFNETTTKKLKIYVDSHSTTPEAIGLLGGGIPPSLAAFLGWDILILFDLFKKSLTFLDFF